MWKFKQTVILLVVLTSLWVTSVTQGMDTVYPSTISLGQEPDQTLGAQPHFNVAGFYVMPETWIKSAQAASANQKTTSLPDDFGYTWDDSHDVLWVDATNGTNTGMTGTSGGQSFGPVALGFDFPYYENNFNQVFVAASGYISFDGGDNWPSQSQIPATGKPNNVIAPYWAPLYLSASVPKAQVYYLTGGSTPERFFVVEWFEVPGGSPEDPIGGDDLFHFQVILYENGDIRFQYKQMRYTGTSYCGAAGIENATGEDGLNYLPFCTPAPSNRAVLFSRPEPSARVRISPQYQSDFISPGSAKSFLLNISNLGDLGEDTFDLTIASKWPVTLIAADELTLLTDTNGNGKVDSGPISPGQTLQIIAKINAPLNIPMGAGDQIAITASSSIEPEKFQMVQLQVAVPSRFGQVFRDNSDGIMRFFMADPNSSQSTQTTGNDWWGYNPAVAETLMGDFFYIWQRWRMAGTEVVAELEFTLLDFAGMTSKPVTRLTDHSEATQSIFDEEPVVAAAADGSLAIAWRRRSSRIVSGVTQENWNVYLAILDPTGSLTYGPLNLTQNTSWYQSSPPINGAPRFWNIRLAATEDNHFFITWRRESQEAPSGACSQNCKLDDIFYTVRTTDGAQVKPITRLTNDTLLASDAYSSPNLTGISENRVLLVYSHTPGGMAYSVLDSQGNLLKATTYISGSGWSTAAMQFSAGEHILIAWTAWVGMKPEINYLILDGSTFQPIRGPLVLTTPAAETGSDFVSLSPDGHDHAIMTWMDYGANNRRHLYYALLNNDGALITDPMIFQKAKEVSGNPHIETGFSGYSNTTNRQFQDMPYAHWAVGWAERLYDAGITTGCTVNPPQFCPNETTTRAQMAVFLGRGMYGAEFIPPPVSESIFEDIPDSHWAKNWIEQLYKDGLTQGCTTDPLRYCPEKNITRDEMAVFLVRAIYGYDYVPPAPTGLFADVPSTYWAAPWIEQLYREGITTGCATSPLRFCPGGETTRAEMAAFLGRTFNIP